MSANELPDELWRKIMEVGVKTLKLSYKDLCCVSISCRRLCRLSCEDSLWYCLFSLDFPHQIGATSPLSSSAKHLYRTRFEREKERKLAAHRRALLRKESEIAEWCRRIREMETRLLEETGRLQAAMTELLNLQKASISSFENLAAGDSLQQTEANSGAKCCSRGGPTAFTGDGN